MAETNVTLVCLGVVCMQALELELGEQEQAVERHDVLCIGTVTSAGG